MNEIQDTATIWDRMQQELQASREATNPQFGWLHWEMAGRYAAMLVQQLGLDINAPTGGARQRRRAISRS